jgi:hypothetical protein
VANRIAVFLMLFDTKNLFFVFIFRKLLTIVTTCLSKRNYCVIFVPQKIMANYINYVLVSVLHLEALDIYCYFPYVRQPDNRTLLLL